MTNLNIGMPEWHISLSKTLLDHADNIESRFFQVASVDACGYPQNRTMVFRGFNEENILAVCDIRSDKYDQWKNQAHAQICWYFNESREQFRLTCTVELITDLNHLDTKLAETEHPKSHMQTLRDKVWEGLSKASQAQFSWPAPLIPFDENAQTNNTSTLDDDKNTCELKPHKHFVLVCFSPSKIDYLNLRATPHIREITKRLQAGVWECTSVQP